MQWGSGGFSPLWVLGRRPSKRVCLANPMLAADSKKITNFKNFKQVVITMKKERRQINFRLTEDEWDLLEYKLQNNNIQMSISAYAKQQTLHGQVNCLGLSSDEVKKITTSLARIGNNLNQIAKIMHQGKLPCLTTLDNILLEIAEMKKLLFNLFEIKNQKKLKKLNKSEKKFKLFFDIMAKKGISKYMAMDAILAILYPNVFQFEITEISLDEFLKIFMDVSEKIESEESKGT